MCLGSLRRSPPLFRDHRRLQLRNAHSTAPSSSVLSIVHPAFFARSTHTQQNRVSQDSFYKSLTPEQSKIAFANQYDFDSPPAFDFDKLRECLVDLKGMQTYLSLAHTWNTKLTTHRSRLYRESKLPNPSVLLCLAPTFARDPISLWCHNVCL